MKVKISKQALLGQKMKMVGKPLRLFQHKKEEESDLQDLESEFNRTFSSIGSGIQILNGSFSAVRPIENPEPSAINEKIEEKIDCNPGPSATNEKIKEKIDCNPGPSATNEKIKEKIDCNPGPSRVQQMSESINVIKFKPMAASTPYEDITDDEDDKGGREQYQEREEEIQDDPNLSFNFQDDVREVRRECKNYLTELTTFIEKTQNMVKDRIQKRTILRMKLKKYQKKISAIQESLNDIERFINFGSRFPRILENV